MKIIEPSLLSIDKTKPIEQLRKIKELGINLIHYDVMDGKFVPPTSFTTEYLEELKTLDIKANVHLMVSKPEKWFCLYKNYKINSIVFHVETQSIDESKKLLEWIHDLGFLAGISIKPNTNLKQYKTLFNYCDIIMIMSVEPGWGGQGFLQQSLKNLAIANEAKKINPKLIIEIDGGINIDYIRKLYKEVDWFVTGSWFFKNIDHMDQYLKEFEQLIRKV